jgi:hypothetical protein
MCSQPESDGFEDALGADLDGVRDALRIAAGDLAAADGHGATEHFHISFAMQFELADSL